MAPQYATAASNDKLAACRTFSEKVTQFGEEKPDQMITGFDGQQASKTAMLQFTLAHEMYHRGQLTVYP